jgi:PKD repeat protein
MSLTLFAWGENSYGQLGTGNVISRSSPVSVINAFIPTRISAGLRCSAAIDDNGMIWTWGLNDSGQLGNNDAIVNQSSPVSICRSGSYVDVKVGDNFCIALDSLGTVWTWGNNNTGQLGNNEDDPSFSGLANRSSPVSICRPGSYVKIGVGGAHALAIDDSGMIWAWGANWEGQIGDGTLDHRSSPVSIARLGSYTEVVGGSSFSFAIDYDGMVYGWGFNSMGQVGEGTIENRSSPVSIIRSGIYKSISAGSDHALAIGDSGMIWAWGRNDVGSLGINNLNNTSSPVSICRPGSYVTVRAGERSSLAIDGSGKVWAWGRNDEGQLGTNSINGTSSPVSIAGVYYYSDISTAWEHVIALEDTDRRPPEANFTATPTNLSQGLQVNFTDTSLYTPTTWSWDFGDGNVSTLQNPTNTYTYAGYYTVSLIVTNAFGSHVTTKTDYITVNFADTEQKTDYIQVTSSTPVANFSGIPTSGDTPLSIAFTDLSTGTVTSWSWDFGDGSPLDTTQNPTHIYAVAGNYTVILSINGGVSTETKPNYIQVSTPVPVGPSGLSILKVFGNGNLTLNSYVTVTGSITVSPGGTIVTVADELMDTIISPTYDPKTFNGKSSYITSLYSNINIQGTIDGAGYGFPPNTGPGANSTLSDNMGNSISQYGASHAGLGAGQGIPGTTSLREEYFTLSSLQADQKFVILTYYPSTPYDVAVNVIQGGPQAYGLDFYVEENKLYWRTEGLELLLTEGDIIRVLYAGDSSITIPASKKTYGSYEAPTSIGSGSGEAAGGSGVKLVARCGTVSIDGTVNMNGENGITARSGGGAGGSVWVEAFKIDGTGFISADGGNASYIYAGGGGGGYITLNYDKECTFSGTMSVQAYKGASEGITWVEPIEPFFWEKFTGTIWNTKWWDGTVAPVVLDNNVAMDTTAGDFRSPQVNSLFSISGKNILTDVDFSCGPTEPASHTSYFKLVIDSSNWVGVARDQSSLLAIDSINGIIDQTSLPYALTPTVFRIQKSDTTFAFQFIDSTAGPQTIRSKDIPGFQNSKFTVRLGTEKVSSDDLNVTWDNFKVFSGVMHDIETTESKIYVDSSNGSDANDGRILTPLQNLFVATAWARHSGTVVLYDGTYNPTEIEHKNLTLMGANGAHPLITTAYVQDTTGSNWERSCLTLRDCGGMVKNINLSDATVAITTEETDSIEVQNCNITDSSVGISFVGYTRDPQIIRNTIRRTSRAIVFDTQCFDPYVYSNVIHDCTNGIEAYDTHNLIVSSNTIDTGRSGVYLDRSSFAQVVSNNLTHIGPVFAAVQVSADSSATLYNNNFFASAFFNSGPIIDASNNISVDPKYINYPARDFQLQASSPDRSSGSQRFDHYYLDRRGARRLSEPGYDIGAYEFIDSTVHPSGAYYVGWNGDDYLNNGTEVSKYRTLDKAMVNADASVVIDGGLYDSYFLALRNQEVKINPVTVLPGGRTLTILRLQTHDSQINITDTAFVSGSGSDSSGVGSPSNPYRTIQKALQDSSASNILVLSGEYELFNGVDNKTLVAFADRTRLEYAGRYLEDLFWTPPTMLPNHTIDDSLWNLDASSFIQEGYIGLTYDGVNTSEVTSVFSFTPNYEIGIELRQTVDPINFSAHNADNTVIISYNNSDWTSTLYTGNKLYSCWSTMGTVERTPFTDYLYIGGDATSNKSIPLSYTLDSSNVSMNIVGGSAQEVGTDFYIQDSHIKWDGKGLESEIAVGDILRVIYYARELSDLLQFKIAVNDGLLTIRGRGVSGSWTRLMKRTLLSDSSSPWSASFYMDRTGSVVDRSITYGHGYGSKFHLNASSITGTDRDEPYAMKTWRQPITLYNSGTI